MKIKFYICRHCDNLVGMIKDSGVPMVCCGEKMEALTPNTVELPAAHYEDGAVYVHVGTVDHPMLPEHYIQQVYLQAENGGQRKTFTPGEAPEHTFCIGNDQPIAVYAYCNLHGLWMTEIQ